MQKVIKIKLISPRMSLRPMDSEFKRRMSPSLSLVTIASLTPPPHFVYIEDENVQPVNFSDKPDLVGITVNVDTSYRAFEISKRYREKGIKVIFGGIHASSNPDLVADHCDSVCIGEAEELWCNIINDFLNNNLQNRYYNSNPTNLELVPLPKWDYIQKNQYLYSNIVVASRGCPFKCDFCYNSCDYINRTYRNRPVSQVVSEIKNLETKQVMFIDDNLIGDIKWTNNLLDELKPLNLTWHCAVSANLVNYPDLIRKMAESGCRSLFIGFESIHSDSVKSVNKSQNRVSEYENLIAALHARQIMVNASVVFGFDHDTKDTFQQTLEWLIKNRIETMTAHILTPYPGTRLYKTLENENRILDYDLSKYNTSHVVFRPKNMTPAELRNGYLKIYKDFYSIRNIIRRKPVQKNLVMPYLMFNLGYRKYGKFTSLVGKLGLMDKIGALGRKLAYGID